RRNVVGESGTESSGGAERGGAGHHVTTVDAKGHLKPLCLAFLVGDDDRVSLLRPVPSTIRLGCRRRTNWFYRIQEVRQNVSCPIFRRTAHHDGNREPDRRGDRIVRPRTGPQVHDQRRAAEQRQLHPPPPIRGQGAPRLHRRQQRPPEQIAFGGEEGLAQRRQLPIALDRQRIAAAFDAGGEAL